MLDLDLIFQVFSILCSMAFSVPVCHKLHLTFESCHGKLFCTCSNLTQRTLLTLGNAVLGGKGGNGGNNNGNNANGGSGNSGDFSGNGGIAVGNNGNGGNGGNAIGGEVPNFAQLLLGLSGTQALHLLLLHCY